MREWMLQASTLSRSMSHRAHASAREEKSAQAVSPMREWMLQASTLSRSMSHRAHASAREEKSAQAVSPMREWMLQASTLSRSMSHRAHASAREENFAKANSPKRECSARWALTPSTMRRHQTSHSALYRQILPHQLLIQLLHPSGGHHGSLLQNHELLREPSGKL